MMKNEMFDLLFQLFARWLEIVMDSFDWVSLKLKLSVDLKQNWLIFNAIEIFKGIEKIY